MENEIFYVVGEDIEGDIIEHYFEGDLDSCVAYCERILTFVGGGHLDIFIEEDYHEVFIQDVEL